MAELKNMTALAEVEYCLGRYLSGNIGGIMSDVRRDLTEKQGQEILDYQKSLGGILSSMASAAHPGVDNSMQILKATGEWNSKTTEDYIQMCRDKVLSNREIYHDIVALTVEWRAAIVAEIGQQKYNEASKQIGCDLAAAYIDYRIQQIMVDRLVDEQTPKSTSEYIIKKAAEGSLFGLPMVMSRSPLEAQIAKEAEEKYKASGWEWAGAKAVSFGMDTVSTMGFGSWSSLVKLAGVEVVFAGIEAYADSKDKENPMTIEECISKGVFGSDTNLFDDVRGKAGYIDAERSETVARINTTLDRPVGTFNLGGYFTRGAKALFSPLASLYDNVKNGLEAAIANQANQQSHNENETKQSYKSAESELAARSGEKLEDQTMSQPIDNQAPQSEEQRIVQEQQANQAGWGSLMADLGFTGLGDIGRNLGYVIAMLPDILVGTMTGKTQSLHLRDNLVPMASIVAGMFIKNPIMKMLLIGMGGMNLINKAGHESIDRHNNPDGVRFKRYDDEELNPRITSPVINGNCLVANIDRTPCSIILPANVVAAYKSGALPLNTLANAVLARHEANSQLAQENYRVATEENQIQNNRQIR